MLDLEQALEKGVSALIGAIWILTPVILWFKKRAQRRRSHLHLSGADESLIGDEKELRSAEAEVAQAPMGLREQILQEHELYFRYSTMNGFTPTYMDDLTEALRKGGVSCDYYFQESVPPGVGAAFIQRQGIFELYVHREQRADADRIIKAWEQKSQPKP